MWGLKPWREGELHCSEKGEEEGAGRASGSCQSPGGWSRWRQEIQHVDRGEVADTGGERREQTR